MNELLALALFAADLICLALLIQWRVRGKPLPVRLEWLREHRCTAWIFRRLRPVQVRW